MLRSGRLESDESPIYVSTAGGTDCYHDNVSVRYPSAVRVLNF